MAKKRFQQTTFYGPKSGPAIAGAQLEGELPKWNGARMSPPVAAWIAG
jgi:hypothetical protein